MENVSDLCGGSPLAPSPREADVILLFSCGRIGCDQRGFFLSDVWVVITGGSPAAVQGSASLRVWREAPVVLNFFIYKMQIQSSGCRPVCVAEVRGGAGEGMGEAHVRGHPSFREEALLLNEISDLLAGEALGLLMLNLADGDIGMSGCQMVIVWTRTNGTG